MAGSRVALVTGSGKRRVGWHVAEALADTWLRKGQPQQAVFYLERVVQTFPNSRHAETAQVRLSQIQGAPSRATEVKK